MLRHIFFCVLGVFLISEYGLCKQIFGTVYVPTKGEIWPKPQHQETSDQFYTFEPSKFKMNTSGKTCDILERAIERYTTIVRDSRNLAYRFQESGKPRGDAVGLHKELTIELTAPCEEYPYYNMDESYDLVICNDSKLSSKSVWGLLRGLESWSQLFYFTDDYSEMRINETRITDQPRYSFRGLMLDTSRHFLKMSNILKTLDAMAMNKLNVFHWHMVDDPSFSYQSEKFPQLSAKGAFHKTMVYTKADIQKVVQYARDRGIRVLPELDVPGHTRSWGEAYPEVLTECYGYNGRVDGLGPLNPTKNATYDLLKDLILEIQEWFPDKHFHVGGDEVDLGCWNSNPELKQYMREHQMSAAQLHGLFMSKVIPLLGERSTPIVWQEVYDEGVELSRDTLIHVWKWHWVEEMIKILKADKLVLYSSSWYLDQLQNGGDWVKYWTADPRQMVESAISNKTLLENIVGGEACMWGEVVDDTNVMTRTWPRASAAAERLWSAALPAGKSAAAHAQTDATHRLEEHTCRMLRRGVTAQPPTAGGFCLY